MVHKKFMRLLKAIEDWETLHNDGFSMKVYNNWYYYSDVTEWIVESERYPNANWSLQMKVANEMYKRIKGKS